MITIDDSAGVPAAVTAMDAVALCEPETAVMVAVPTETAETNPAAFTVATGELLEDQVTVLVMSCMLPSE